MDAKHNYYHHGLKCIGLDRNINNFHHLNLESNKQYIVEIKLAVDYGFENKIYLAVQVRRLLLGHTGRSQTRVCCR